MVTFAETPLRPYEPWTGGSLRAALEKSKLDLHLSHEFMKLSSGLEHPASAFRVYRSLRMMNLLKRNPILVGQPLLSSWVTLNLVRIAGHWKSRLSYTDGQYILPA